MESKYNKEFLIYSIILGDGWICNKDVRIQHCEKQLGYLKWKRKLLIRNGIKCGKIKFRDNNGKPAYYFYTKSYDFIRDFKLKHYKPSKKECIINNLHMLTPLSLAIWYMDDGGLSKKNKNGVYHANELMINTGLCKEYNQVIIDYLKSKWGLNFSQCKNRSVYRLRCGTKEARKFADIIKDYVIKNPELLYKIDIKDYII